MSSLVSFILARICQILSDTVMEFMACRTNYRRIIIGKGSSAKFFSKLSIFLPLTWFMKINLSTNGGYVYRALPCDIHPQSASHSHYNPSRPVSFYIVLYMYILFLDLHSMVCSPNSCDFKLSGYYQQYKLTYCWVHNLIVCFWL